MYKEFYGLRANPFNVNPDPRYLFLTRHTEEALACLTYGIQSRKGFVLLTGEVGTGKTTLINKLLEWLRLQQVATAFVFNSRLNVPQFLDYMMADFGIPCDTKSKSQILLKLYNWLLDRYRAGETAVLIVDEAQNLSEELLEEIRMLTNLETFTEKLLQIVLVGQPELEQKLKQPQLRQLRQRLTLRAKTHPLTLEETKAYVQQRLRIENRIEALLFTQGIRKRPSLRSWERDLAVLRTGDRREIPRHLRAELDRLRRRLVTTLELIREVEAERDQAAEATPQDQAYHKIAALSRIRGIGENFAAVLTREVFYRSFDNRRQIASYVGITPMPYQSGGMDRDRRISRAGNPRARTTMIQLAWLWLRYQPGSELAEWFRERVGTLAGRTRRIAIVAMARKLLIALWRYAETGVIPAGAEIRAETTVAA